MGPEPGGRQVLKRCIVPCLLCAVVASTSAPAVVIRHDRDDDAHRRAAEGLTCVVEIGRGHGVLVAPSWILTGAGVVAGTSPLTGSAKIDGIPYAIRRIVFHPDWRGAIGEGERDRDPADLALVELARPLEGARTAPPYDGRDETGAAVTVVGAGLTGNGETGPERSSRQPLRAATNTVARADSAWLWVDFDPPLRATDLEGIAGPGDEGGPLLWRDGDRLRVMGVFAFNRHEALGLPACTYGTSDAYVRVSSHLDWIRAVLAGEDERSALRDLRETSWPAGRVAEIAQTFFATYNAGDADSLAAFERAWRAPEELALIPARERARHWLGQLELSGPVRPLYCVLLDASRLEVLAAARRYWRSYRFELEPAGERRLVSISVAREQSLQGERLPRPEAFLE
jgi:hypothetical protein